MAIKLSLLILLTVLLLSTVTVSISVSAGPVLDFIGSFDEFSSIVLSQPTLLDFYAPCKYCTTN